MKTKIFVIFAVLLLLITLNSCSTTIALFKSGISGTPFWVQKPQSRERSGEIAFLGKGNASLARQAELFAYDDVLKQISDYIGEDLGSTAYKELSTLGTLERFSLSVREKYSDDEGNTWILAIAKKSELEEDRTAELTRRINVQSEIESLVTEGDNFTIAGEEIRAAKQYLQAANLAYGEDFLPKEFSFQTLLDDVAQIFSNLTVTLSSEKGKLDDLKVSVRKKVSFLQSKVQEATIKAEYCAVNPQGKTYQDSFVFNTGNSGDFYFQTLNPAILTNGEIVFSIDLDTEIEALELKAGEEAIAEIKALLESKKVVFNYSKTFAEKETSLIVFEFDSRGNFTGNSFTTEYLAKCFSDYGLPVAVFDSEESSDEEELISSFKEENPKKELLLICRIGIVQVIEAKDGQVTVSVEGDVKLVNVLQDEVIYQSGTMNSAAWDENAQKASEKAFLIFAQVAFSLLKAVYV